MTDFAIFDENGIATQTGDAVCYGYDENGIFTGEFTFFTLIGSGIPARSTLIPPPNSNTNQIPVFKNGWSLTHDYRGQIVYNIETGEAEEIKAIGDYPENTTTLAPWTKFDRWSGDSWVTDVSAQNAAAAADAAAKKNTLLAAATAIIEPLKDALDGGYIDEADKPVLIEWQKYRYALTKIDPSTIQDVNWPKSPTETTK
ncbi:tail fiber assembly protein [Leclercia adecarboxylata]|uniref:tail fiber assembly protein n=1 Tax=Leclercia adecarboxylata TaxID=83655 RepID=UPI0013C87076|nr:tail fiber assembly protein [Leclercia adecarboxylata]NEG94053.1 tail fiber assembly protein [Leclercia adecarboxylata]